ncbi:hypothetical protein ACFXO9_30620 [Nocardia tengchongensis]|uniref:hypothetical protein n=1 Tax=Nocardia tengchongensis TaxID=2055889 RepID=UPI00367DCEED
MLALGPYTDDLTKRIRVTLSRSGAVAIFVPALAHFQGRVPDEIRAAAVVIAVDTQETIPRWNVSEPASADQ